ncbi:MAG: 4-hydroxy-tetrahydrodipicolinate synthase [bacterium]
MWQGSMVAIVTPFKNNRLDEKTLKDLVEFHIAHNTKAIVPCGTTGESPTLSHAEHDRLIKLVVEYVAGRIPVIAGTGSNSTQEAIELTMNAEKAGADGALLIAPYYNKPTQEGIFQHYKAISEAVDLPSIVYNIPSRTGINILPETIARLAELKNIVGLKDAAGSLSGTSETIKLCGDKICVLAGDDALALPIMAVGGVGVISVAANIIPQKMSSFVDKCLNGKWKEAREDHYHLFPLFQAMFIETNPVPVKTALAMMGKIDSEIRLPLFKMSEANTKKLRDVLMHYDLVS